MAGKRRGGRTRAQQVRSQRAMDRQDRDARPAAAPPRRKKGRRVQRRYDLALPLETGVELQLPSVPQIHLGVRFFSAVLLIGVLWAIHQALNGPTFRIDRAEVLGASVIEAGQVRSIVGLDGELSFMVDPALAIQRLEAYPEVAAAQVEVVWPNRLTVEVEERMPVVAWDDGGRSWLLSREGVAYLQRDVMTQVVHIRADQPVLRLSEDPNEPAIATSILDAALALAAEAPSETVFTFDAIHGLGFQDRRGWQVYFGAAGDMAAKVRMYQALGVDLERRGVVVEMVSVEDLEMPYYKKGR